MYHRDVGSVTFYMGLWCGPGSSKNISLYECFHCYGAAVFVGFIHPASFHTCNELCERWGFARGKRDVRDV